MVANVVLWTVSEVDDGRVLSRIAFNSNTLCSFESSRAEKVVNPPVVMSLISSFDRCIIPFLGLNRRFQCNSCFSFVSDAVGSFHTRTVCVVFIRNSKTGL